MPGLFSSCQILHRLNVFFSSFLLESHIFLLPPQSSFRFFSSSSFYLFGRCANILVCIFVIFHPLFSLSRSSLVCFFYFCIRSHSHPFSSVPILFLRRCFVVVPSHLVSLSFFPPPAITVPPHPSPLHPSAAHCADGAGVSPIVRGGLCCGGTSIGTATRPRCRRDTFCFVSKVLWRLL